MRRYRWSGTETAGRSDEKGTAPGSSEPAQYINELSILILPVEMVTYETAELALITALSVPEGPTMKVLPADVVTKVEVVLVGPGRPELPPLDATSITSDSPISTRVCAEPTISTGSSGILTTC